MVASAESGPSRPWVRHYDPGVPADVAIPEGTIQDQIEAATRDGPNRTALIFYGSKWTYRDLWEQSGRFAGFLTNHGVRPGGRVGLYLPNCPAHPIAYLGTLRAGATVVQVSPLYIGQDLAKLLQDAELDAIVSLDIHYPQLVKGSGAPLPLAVVAPLRDFYPRLTRLFVNRVLHRRGLPTGVPSDPKVVAWKSAISTPAPTTFPMPPGGSDAVAVLQYTSGTTGLPKGAMLTHRNLVANVAQCRAWNQVSYAPGTEVFLAVIPLFHVYALTVALNYALFRGGCIVLQLRPDIPETLKLIRRYRPTHLPGVPALYAALAQHPKVRSFDLGSIRLCSSGSAPLPVEVQKRFEQLTGGRVVEGYGLSETSPVTHTNPILGERKLGSIGLPLPSTDQKVVDLETGTKERAVGEEGELVVRGPQVMLGYFRQPEETARLLKDGWFFTGDIARLDTDGFAYIVDRKKDLIVVGGFNVWPREVEEVLFQHPAVAEAAVVGAPDPILGEVPFAFVVRKPGVNVSQAELIEFVRSQLAHYKAPRGIEFREALPRSGVQKVLRRVLRESAGAQVAPTTAPGR